MTIAPFVVVISVLIAMPTDGPGRFIPLSYTQEFEALSPADAKQVVEQIRFSLLSPYSATQVYAHLYKVDPTTKIRTEVALEGKLPAPFPEPPPPVNRLELYLSPGPLPK